MDNELTEPFNRIDDEVKTAFKAVVLEHVTQVLSAAEWRRFRSMSTDETRSSRRGEQAQPQATPAELVSMAMTEDAITLLDALPAPLKNKTVEIATIAGQAVYYVRGEGIYVWARDLRSRTILSVWLTHPAYPPCW